METKEILRSLRTKSGLSQDALAEKVFVTRQAVSRWETGETVPGTETLKLLSKLYDVSINTLLGSPQQLFCQCCGMPLNDSLISREPDCTMNEQYCKWCYADGQFLYHNLDDLIDVCVRNMTGTGRSEAELRTELQTMLPQLDYWKQHHNLDDGGAFEAFRQTLIDEINALQIKGMPRLKTLNALVGSYVNLAYPLPNGNAVQFLDDCATYLGYQLQSEDGGRCFGVLANKSFILICTYEANGENPELLLYQKR